MINVELKNGSILQFHDYEQVTTFTWISGCGSYYAGEKRMRADKLTCGLFVVERIDELGDVVAQEDWISPIKTVRKFIPTLKSPNEQTKS